LTLTLLPNWVLVPIAVASMVSLGWSSAEMAGTAAARNSVSNRPTYLNFRAVKPWILLFIIVFILSKGIEFERNHSRNLLILT
jgi:hypothetical protein